MQAEEEVGRSRRDRWMEDRERWCEAAGVMKGEGSNGSEWKRRK